MTTRDGLGDRQKQNFENRTRYYLPRRTYTLLRADGQAFHSYTKNCKRPYDKQLMNDMDKTAKALCEEIQGVELSYVQSDEISLLLTDFATIHTESWFDGNIQKMCSISASIATAAFNWWRYGLEVSPTWEGYKAAHFDSRVWTIPDPIEVENYFIWRQQDATRNSISMTAQAHFSHKELQNKSCDEMQEMLFQKGINWNDMPDGFKRGRCVIQKTVKKDVEYTDKRTGNQTVLQNVERKEWTVVVPPVFTQEREFLQSRIPLIGGGTLHRQCSENSKIGSSEGN